jgi:heme-degrading monooxygenase HmoA
MYSLGILQVEDYDSWKAQFELDESAARRKAAGIQSMQVFRSQEDPNSVAVLTEWDDPQSMQRFMESAELKEAMKKSSIISSVVYLPIES